MANSQKTLSRRDALLTKGACLTLAAIPGTASAAISAAETIAQPEVVAPPLWHDATGTELARLVGDRFRFYAPQHGTIAMKLVALEDNPSGVARPKDLPRRDGVTALFEGPDMAPIVAEGDGIYDVFHPRMGHATLFVTAVPTRNGGALIELVLN